MPARHSTPARPPATQSATNASHGSPAATSSAVPSRATPRVAMRTTVPAKPSSATTTFEPPASTSSGSPARSAAVTASITACSLGASTKRAAGPPRRRVVSSLSNTAPQGRDPHPGVEGRSRMPLPALSLPRRPSARAAGACACVLALLAGGWLWLRDSRLVAVDQVSVTGLSGSEAPRVRAALEGAARDMTTLHVRSDQLRTAVEPFPAVMAVDAHADFPHRLRIVVHEHVAVAALAAGTDRVPVAADGTLLRGSSTSGLPVVTVGVPAARGHAGRQAHPARRRAAGRGAARAAGQGQPRLRGSARPHRAAERRARSCTSAAPTACARSGPPRPASSPTAARPARRTSTCACPSGRPPAASWRRTPRQPDAPSQVGPQPAQPQTQAVGP